MRKVFLPLCLLVFSFISQTLFAQFSGAFAPANWTFSSTTPAGDGSVDESGAPASIILYGSDSGGGGCCNLSEQYTITIPSNGTISFDYDVVNPDWDESYYVLNGTNTLISNGGTGSLSNIAVNNGDVFGFLVQNHDNGAGRGYITVSNFVFTPSGPSITAHPAARSVCAGNNATFFITATGATTYHWQVDQGSGFSNVANSAPYSGVTNDTLTIVAPTTGMSGYLYRCVVDSATNSNSAALTVHTVPTLVATPDTQVCSGSPVVLNASGSPAGVSSIALDGTDDYLNIAHHADLRPNTGITLAAWVYPVATTGTWGFIFGKEFTPTDQDYLLAVTASNQIHGRFMMTGAYWYEFTTGFTIPYGAWTHIALTYDNTTIKLYVNGELRYTETVSLALNMGSSTPLNLGRRGDGVLNFNGRIDEAAIWNEAITQSEVDALMDFNVAGAGTGLVAYWPMNEGAGTTAADASGNGHTATLTNGPTWVQNYQWSPATGLSATSGPTVTATITSSQTYTLSHTSYPGCAATATVDVNIAPSCPPIWNGTNTWSSNPNWTNGTPDVSDSVVVLTGTLTVDANATIDDLTLENGTSLIVQAGKTLTVKGDLINNGGTFNVQTGGAMIFERNIKKAAVTRMRTFGKIKVMSGSLHLRN